MNVRPFTATRRGRSAVGTAMLGVAFVAAVGQTIAYAQGGRASNQRPAQGPGVPNNLNPYGIPLLGGSYSPYPVRDPTADERAVVASRVYRAVLDEWAQRAMTKPRPEVGAPGFEARFTLELTERLGPWSLRWQEAQDNAARSREARYQALADHLARMSALEHGRFLPETSQATGGPAGPSPPRGSAEVARFFRPIDEWAIDGIIPAALPSERSLNTQGVAVTPAEQVEIADQVYHLILDDAVDRFLASPPTAETRPDGSAIFNACLAERLGFWSDLWRKAQDVTPRDRSARSPAVGDRAARVALAGAQAAGPDARSAALRSHIERMRELENSRFATDALKRAGRAGVQPVDTQRSREFAEVVRFFRIEAESRLPGAARAKGADVTGSDQAATADRVYRAILDEAARRCRETPSVGKAPVDSRGVCDARLAERLAAWSIRWARAQIRADLSRASQFNAIRGHIERMAALEDGRSFHDAFERAGPPVDRAAKPALAREFADVARFFHLEGLWEFAQAKSR